MFARENFIADDVDAEVFHYVSLAKILVIN